MCHLKSHRSLQHNPIHHTHVVLFSAVCLLSLHLASATPTTPAPVNSLYFGPYLKPGQLPEGKLLPLYQATWRIAGHQLHQDNLTAAVRNLTQFIFESYSFHAQLDGLQPSQPAPVTLDGQIGRFIACNVSDASGPSQECIWC